MTDPEPTGKHYLLGPQHKDANTQHASAGDLVVANANKLWSRLAIGTSAQILRVGADLMPYWGPVPAHNLLSSTHSGDTLGANVVRGDVIVGNSTPKWSRLAIGTSGKILVSDGTDAAWNTVNLLSATHGDTLAGSVARGDIMYGNSTPKWANLAKGTSGQVLGTDGTDVAWTRKIGGQATNYAEFETTGFLTFAGTARYWSDLQFPVASGKIPAVNFPTWEAFTSNTSAYSFATNDKIDLQANELPHNWAEGTTVEVHCHL